MAPASKLRIPYVFIGWIFFIVRGSLFESEPPKNHVGKTVPRTLVATIHRHGKTKIVHQKKLNTIAATKKSHHEPSPQVPLTEFSRVYPNQ